MTKPGRKSSAFGVIFRASGIQTRTVMQTDLTGLASHKNGIGTCDVGGIDRLLAL